MTTHTEWIHGRGAWSTHKDIESYDHETRSIYESPSEPSYVCWVVAWTDPDGVSKVSFVEVAGPPSLHPTYHFNDPHLECYSKTLYTEDGGDTWKDTGWREPLDSLDGNSDHHWRAVVVDKDGGLIRMMSQIIPGMTDPEGRRHVYDPVSAETAFPFRSHGPQEVAPKFPAFWRSLDGGKTWREVCLLRERPEGWWPTDMIRLSNRRLLTIGMVYGLQGKDAYYKSARLAVAESEDDARTWSAPQSLDLPIDVFGDIGWTEENALVELSDGKVLAVCRITGPGTRWLAALRRTKDRWEVEDHWVSELPYGGYPFTRRASCGTIFYNGHDGVWSSVNDGRTWTRQSVARAYYPQLVEADRSKIVSLGHVGMGDTAWPAPQETNIQASSFRYRSIQVIEQSDDSESLCLSVIKGEPFGDVHVGVEVKLEERAGIAFHIQDDPEQGYYVCVARLTDGPGRWPSPKTFEPVPLILEIAKITGRRSETLFKRHAGTCVPGTWVKLQVRMEGTQMLGAVLIPEGPRPQYIAARDASYSSGRVGLFTHLSKACFKNLTVSREPHMIRGSWEQR